MASDSILIIDDDPDVLDALQILLEDEFKHIHTESNPHRIPSLLKINPDVILLDMNFSAGINSGNEGLFWLSEILQTNPESAVVMMTAYGNIQLAVEAIKRGARDFILKPWDNQKLVATLHACIRRQKGPAINRPIAKSTHLFLEGESIPMVELQEQIRKVAPTEASVLILGENGTGKEVVAREIHRLSQRSKKTFLTVDLSTLSETLFESELFGHRKGAFTDARADRKGRFESADEGTLFLDEIGNLPANQQAKLLTALQNREVIPVGSNQPVRFNVRLITATNAPLTEMTDQGKFRQDLLYRINTISLHVPPLRQRGRDILSLANHFLAQYSEQYKKLGLSFSSEAESCLLKHEWPGNVRELQHTVEKTVILSDDKIISERDLNLSTSSRTNLVAPARTLEDIEKEALVNALNGYNGNILQAAKALGITRQTLYNKMKKYGI